MQTKIIFLKLKGHKSARHRSNTISTECFAYYAKTNDTAVSINTLVELPE